ncbi:MAG: hypothetical protein ACK4RK_11725 [Gemmataceae bacterium]
MARRQSLVLILAGVLACTGASYRTTNFVVEAATPQIAQQVGQLAERYRREKALEWLGQEMPPWPQPCPLRVTVTMGGAGGATSFAFDPRGGPVLSQQMQIEGSLERVLNSVLPHEVTHTVFAFHFRRPVPRWADEGGAVLSEDDAERTRHDRLCRQILNTPGRAMPLRRLFALKEYPSDVMALYAQGFSVTSFLVGNSDRQTFLRFVGHGMAYGWDSAAQHYYRYRNVEELEQAWLDHMRRTKQAPVDLAHNTQPGAQPAAGLALNTRPSAPAANPAMARHTLPPAQPVLAPPQPIIRGQSPDEDTVGSWAREPRSQPDYLPPYAPPPAGYTSGSVVAPPPAPPAWEPASAGPPPTVRLGPPQYVPPPPMPSPAPSARPLTMSPIGYPYP